MREYVVFWRVDGPHIASNVSLPDDTDPRKVSTDEWVDMAEEAEGGDLSKYRPSAAEGGYELIAVLAAPVTFIY